MIEIFLPWFDSRLRPNEKVHYKVKAMLVKRYRWKSYLLSKKHKGLAPDGHMGLKIIFYPPTDNSDLDGCISAIKSGLDGVADGLKVNDRNFRPLFSDFGEPDKENPRVEISIFRGLTCLGDSLL